MVRRKWIVVPLDLVGLLFNVMAGRTEPANDSNIPSDAKILEWTAPNRSDDPTQRHLMFLMESANWPEVHHKHVPTEFVMFYFASLGEPESFTGS